MIEYILAIFKIDYVCLLDTVPLFSSPEIELDLQAASFDHFVPAFNLTDSSNGSNGFTMLGDGEASNLSYHIRVCRIMFKRIAK